MTAVLLGGALSCALCVVLALLCTLAVRYGAWLPERFGWTTPARAEPAGVWLSLAHAVWRPHCESCPQPRAGVRLHPLYGGFVPCVGCRTWCAPLEAGAALGTAVFMWVVLGHADPVSAGAVAAGALIVFAMAGSDRRASTLPASLCVTFVWLGLVASPLTSVADRVAGAAGLYLMLALVVIFASHAARERPGSAEPRADPLDPGVGGGDVLLAAGIGAWLGLLPSLLCLLVAVVLFAAWSRLSGIRVGPLAPCVAFTWIGVVCALYVVPAVDALRGVSVVLRFVR